VVPRRMRQGNPTQEIAHSSIFGPLEHEVPMIRHQLIRKNAAWIADKPFGKNILKRFVVAFLVENDRSSIATVQGMVDRILLVGEFRAGHPNSSTTPNLAVKSPDHFSSPEGLESSAAQLRRCGRLLTNAVGQGPPVVHLDRATQGMS